VDAVLGLSVTPSAVGFVLVDEQDADGVSVDREAFEIPRRRRSTAEEASQQAAAAVVRTEAQAAARGQRLQSIGVTWSEDADLEASLLMRSLSDRGFDNVVPIRLPEATEALAWGVAEIIGRDITAVCVIEPANVMALIVHTREGAVQTAVNHAIDDEESLVRWLCTVFTRADWQPQALIMVGSAGMDDLMPRLEDVLSVPVFAPADAELALARGAALASTQTDAHLDADEVLGADTGFGVHETAPGADAHVFAPLDMPRRHAQPAASGRWYYGQTGPLAMLMAGAVTFVVSASMAVSLEVTPKMESVAAQSRPTARSSQGVAAAADSVPLAPPRMVASTSITEAPLAPVDQQPAPEAPVDPPAEVSAPPPVGVVDSAAAPAAPVAVDGVPPEAVPAPPDGVPVPPEAVPAPNEGVPPAPPPVAVPAPPPPEHPTLRQRIKDRLSGINRTDEVAQVPPPPADPAPGAAPPDAPPLLPPP
jgi:hypothetical protein